MNIRHGTMMTGALAIAGLMTLSAGSALAQQTAVLAHGEQQENPRHQATLMFAELVEHKTGGDLTIDVIGAAQLGDDDEMIDSTAAGAIQITANSQGSHSSVVPEVALFGLPFLFESLPQAYEVVDGPIGDEIAERSAEEGLQVLAWWDNGIRNISHIDRAITAPGELEGVDIRTPPDRMTVDIFEALGANPEPLAWSEVPSALQAGTFQAQENPLVNIYTASLHEITPEITLTGHKYEVTPVLANRDWFEGLSEEHQQAVLESAEAATWYQRGMSMRQDVRLRETMAAEGATLHEVDAAPFQEATQSVYDAWEERFGGLVDRLRQAAQEAAR